MTVRFFISIFTENTFLEQPTCKLGLSLRKLLHLVLFEASADKFPTLLRMRSGSTWKKIEYSFSFLDFIHQDFKKQKKLLLMTLMQKLDLKNSQTCMAISPEKKSLEVHKSERRMVCSMLTSTTEKHWSMVRVGLVQVLDCRGVLLIWTVFISKMKDSIMNSWILLMFFILLSFWNGLMIFTLTFALLLCFWLFMLLFYLICLQTLFNISADFHFSVQ